MRVMRNLVTELADGHVLVPVRYGCLSSVLSMWPNGRLVKRL